MLLRLALLAAAVIALAGSASSVHTFNQEGTVATPRAPLDDGQPLEERARVQVFGGGGGDGAIAVRGARPIADAGEPSAAAVTRKHAGASLRVRGSGPFDLHAEVEGSWAPTAATPGGAPIAAPDAPVIGVTVGFRTSSPIGDRVRLGVAADLGGQSVPIHRDSPDEVARAIAPVARAALVPSVRVGDVTLYGVAGVSTVTVVPPSVTWTSDDGDPGVQASVGGAAWVLAGGAAVDLARDVRLTARVGDAFSSDVAAGHYGAQVDVGLAFGLR